VRPKRSFTVWPTPLGLGWTMMYGYVFFVGIVCALVTLEAKSEKAIDNIRNKAIAAAILSLVIFHSPVFYMRISAQAEGFVRCLYACVYSATTD